MRFLLIPVLVLGSMSMALRSASAAAASADARPAIAIIVDARPFSNAEEAAVAESRVDWMDRDETDDTACTEAFAATELLAWWTRADHLDATRIRILGPDGGDGAAVTVLVGRAATAFARDSLGTGASLPALPSSPDGYRLASVVRAGRRFVLVEGRTRTGTLYATYDLIERLGVRFFGPDAEATILPTNVLAIPPTLAVSTEPAFAVRGFWAWEPRGTRELWLWMARRRMNQWTAAESDADFLHKLGLRLTIGGHDLQKQFLDPARYASAHPEWYGADAAAAKAAADIGGRNFCTTDPAARATFVGGIRDAWLSGAWKKADEVVVWMSDGGTWCNCARCQAAGGPTERILDLSSAVAETLRVASDAAGRRPPRVSTLAFLETLGWPRAGFDAAALSPALDVTFFPMDRCYAHALADTACPWTNEMFERSLRSWASFHGGGMRGALGLGEYYNIDRNKGLPFVPTTMMAKDLALAHELGLTRFTTMHEPTRLWGPWEWTHLELATLLWDPSADPRLLRSDYAKHAFPSSAARVERTLDELELASSGMKQLLHRVGSPYGFFELRKQIESGKAPRPPAPLGWSDDGPEGPRSPGLVVRLQAARRAKTLLDQAMAALPASAAAERTRLARYRASVAYLVDMLAFYDAFLRADALAVRGDAPGARRWLAKLDPIAARLREVVDLVRTGSSHSNARDGLEATGLEPEWDRLRQSLAAAPPRP